MNLSLNACNLDKICTKPKSPYDLRKYNLSLLTELRPCHTKSMNTF